MIGINFEWLINTELMINEIANIFIAMNASVAIRSVNMDHYPKAVVHVRVMETRLNTVVVAGHRECSK